jgi:hypothetical protein
MKHTISALISLVLLYCGEKGPAVEPRSFVVTADSVRMREKPSIAGSILHTLYAGDEVFVYSVSDKEESISGRRGKWHQVTFGCGASGWIFGAFLTQGGETANSLFAAALKLELKDPKAAIAAYQSLINRFPKATLVNGCHGSWPFSEEAERRISFARCDLEARPGFDSFQDATSYLMEELQRADPELSRLTHCELEIEMGPPAEGIREMLKLLQQAPPAFATPEFFENRVLLIPYANQTPPTTGEAEILRHQFYFEDRGAGWFLKKYCLNCFGIYPAR